VRPFVTWLLSVLSAVRSGVTASSSPRPGWTRTTLWVVATRLSEMHLANFKAFDQFRVSFAGSTFIVGPNNAGKSTLLSAVRAGAHMLRLAANKAPDRAARDGGPSLVAYSMGPGRFGLVEENLRHEFHDVETRMRLQFSSGATTTAVWPTRAHEEGDDQDDEEHGAYFYLNVPDRAQPRRPKAVRDAFPRFGVIPMLSPVELQEVALTDTARVRQQAETRLASRHFRNHLRLLQAEGSPSHGTQLDEFLAFAAPWVPELELGDLVSRPSLGEGHLLDFFHREPGRRALKEIVWAGDGTQVWVQLLLHLFRLRDAEIIVLDEPDLYLHADLQRRLKRVLEAATARTITATHSPEMLAEADPSAVVWVDKSRRRAVRSPRGEVVTDLSDALGSQFNMRLAKALRSRVALFVEGKDMKVLSILARRVGAANLADERNVAVVPRDGFSNWDRVEPFKWLVDHFLAESVESVVFLDRDYRTDDSIDRIESRLGELNITTHVWRRKELESYLLESSALARVSSASPEAISEILVRAATDLRQQVFARSLDKAQRGVRSDHHRVTITEQFQNAFESKWADPVQRLWMCPAKEVLHVLNRELSATGLANVTARRIASALRRAEIAEEMRDALNGIEERITR
jgi:hypothetical protein